MFVDLIPHGREELKISLSGCDHKRSSQTVLHAHTWLEEDIQVALAALSYKALKILGVPCLDVHKNIMRCLHLLVTTSSLEKYLQQ